MPDKLKLKNIITKEALEDGAALQKKKKTLPGFDGMSADGAISWITINGRRLCRDIIDGDYSPMPVRTFNSAKSKGGYRTLSKLSVIDMVIQSILSRELSDAFEPLFSDSSFAYRVGRGVNRAVERYIYLANKNKFAAKLDIASCFDNISHEKLCEILSGFICDKKLIELINTYLKIPEAQGREIIAREKGLVQGAPLSPILCNIYFHIADRYLEEKGIQFIRYADDIVLFSDSCPELSDNLKTVSDFFKRELLLSVNQNKTKIASSAELNFLGHKFQNTRKGIISSESEIYGSLGYYSDWNFKKLKNNKRKINILSDGILRQKDFSILFDTDSDDVVIPPSATDIINVYSNTVFDSGFFSVAAKNGITVNLFNQKGERLGSFIPESGFKAPYVIHEQLMQYYDTPKRLYLAKEFLLASVHNCILNIRYYNKNYENEIYQNAIKQISLLKRKIKDEDHMENLLLYEAKVRQIYYECYDFFSKKDDFKFEKRTCRPPKNKFNALLSFGNAVLYNYVAGEIQKTPLDVRVGYLHATTTRSRSLNLDIAEIFKPLLTDRTILSLINKGSLSDDDFIIGADGTTVLNSKGKDVFLNGFYSKLESRITVKGESMSYSQVITEEIHKLVRHFKEKEKYKAFRQVR